MDRTIAENSLGISTTSLLDNPATWMVGGVGAFGRIGGFNKRSTDFVLNVTAKKFGEVWGKSKFSNQSEETTLIQQATHHSMIRQPNGNFARIVDAGRNIGIDRATGQSTSIYTVITRPNGKLITAFPGTP